MKTGRTTIATLAILLLWPLTAAAQDPAGAPPPTLTQRDAQTLIKRAIRTEMSINTGRRYTRSCTRRSRVRIRCNVRWSDRLGTLYRGTVEVWRTGSGADVREYFRVDARGDRNDAARQRFSGPFVEETRHAKLGQALTLLDQDGVYVRVLPGALLDGVATNEFDQPPPGTRYVGVPLALTNLSPGRFDDSLRNGSKLITADGRTIDAAVVVSGVCSQGDVDIPQGETRLACVAFPVPFGTVVRAFEYGPSSGYAPETGQWVPVGQRWNTLALLSVALAATGCGSTDEPQGLAARVRGGGARRRADQ